MLDKLLSALFFGMVLAAALHAGKARATHGQPLEIFICGHSTYECKSSDGPSTNFPLGESVRAVEIDPTNVKSVVPLRPDTPLPTPSGWTSPTPPSLQPVPPSGAGQTNGFKTDGGFFAATPEASCEAYVHSLFGGNSYETCVAGGTFCQYNFPPNGGGCPNAGGWNITAASECPAGYSLSGGTCTLTNASIVQKPVDGVCGVIRSGNAFTEDGNDPDCTGGAATSGTSSSQADAGVTVSVEIQGDGRAVVTDSRPSLDGNTQVTRVGVSAPDGSGAVAVDGWSRGWSSGTGTEAGEGSVTGSCGGPGQAPCKIDESGTPSDATLSGGNDALTTAEGSGVSGIGEYASTAKRSDLGVSLSVSWPDIACSNPSFNVFGRTMVVEMCAYEADVDAIMSWFVYILGAFAVFGMIREVR